MMGVIYTKKTTAARLLRMIPVTVVLFLVTLGSVPDRLQAQESDPANADPRRVPVAVLWDVDLRGKDVAVGSDGNPVIVDYHDSSPGNTRVTKVEGTSGAIVWDVVIVGVNSWEDQKVAIGSDGNPVVVMNDSSTGDGDLRIQKLDGATGAIIWSVTFDGGPEEFASGVAVGLDGNPVLTGGSNSDEFADIRTAKFDGATGALLWSVSFDGGFLDYPGSIAVTSDGNPVVVGNSDDEIVVGPRLIMYDGATGATLWNVFLAYNPLVGQVEARGVAVGPDGNLIITGEDSSGQTIFTTKIDSTNGAVLWSRFLGDVGVGNDVAIDSSGDPIVTGTRTIKYDGATGEILWSLIKGGASVDGRGNRGIAIGPDGKLFITGDSIVKYDGSVNNILWVARADNMTFEESVESLAIGPDGNPVVTGNPLGLDDFRTIKYDGATGAVLWSVVFDSGGNDNVTGGVAIGPDGNPVIAATSDSGYRVIKYDGTTGAIIWNVTFDNGGDGAATGVAVGPDGNPFIAGTSGSDFRVIKYDGTTGAIIWNVTFDSGVSDDIPSVAVGPDGNPVVAGTSFPGITSSDFRIIKYDGATGSILWNVTFDGGTAFGDIVSGVAVGPDGHPVIVGRSESFSFLLLRTIKYDGATGGIIWNSTSSDDSNLIVGGVAVGLDGDPFVTGVFQDVLGGLVLRMIRYDGATGSLLSALDFDTGDSEEHSAVAVGPDGNPVSVAASAAYEGINLWIIKYLTEVETAAGSNVSVGLNGGTQNVNGATVTYSQVTESGATTFFTNSSGPALPAGFSIGDPPLFYDISTTATFSPPVTVCIAYDPTRFGDPNNARLLHSENNAWVDVTTSNDTINHVVCGQVNGFSLFAVAEALPTPPVTFTFSGFFQPVNNLPVLNRVNAGRAIPVKFSLSGFQGFDIFAAEYPKSQAIVCDSTAPLEGVEETVSAGGSSLSYDGASDQYIYVWKTDKTWENSCRQLVVKLRDGTFHRANFKFMK